MRFNKLSFKKKRERLKHFGKIKLAAIWTNASILLSTVGIVGWSIYNHRTSNQFIGVLSYGILFISGAGLRYTLREYKFGISNFAFYTTVAGIYCFILYVKALFF